MVIDSSALIAILCDEPERHRFNRQIEIESQRFISTASVLETSIVLETRYGEQASHELDCFLSTASIEICSFDNEQLELARHAYRQYGKGRHPASLNYGDCFSYALAKQKGETLLFKGNDFSKTDISAAISIDNR
jgi:ribonuclease VapC